MKAMITVEIWVGGEPVAPCLDILGGDDTWRKRTYIDDEWWLYVNALGINVRVWSWHEHMRVSVLCPE